VTDSDSIILSRSVLVDFIACLTDIKKILYTKYAVLDQDSASDHPNPTFLYDAVLVIQTMTSPVSSRSSSRQTRNTVISVVCIQRYTKYYSFRSKFPHHQRFSEAEVLTSIKKRTRCHFQGESSCLLSPIRRSQRVGGVYVAYRCMEGVIERSYFYVRTIRWYVTWRAHCDEATREDLDLVIWHDYSDVVNWKVAF
jgi:hypothetical protein